MKKTFLQEMRYFLHSKLFILTVLAITVIVALSSTSALSNQKSAIVNFQQLERSYPSDTLFKEDLNKSYSVNISGNSTNQESKTIDNPAPYYLKLIIYANEEMTTFGFPLYVLKTMGLALIPLVTGILAVELATYDFRYETYQRKLNAVNWRNLILGKFLFFTALVFSIFLFITFLSSIVGIFLPKFSQEFDVGKFGNSVFHYSVSEFLTIFFLMFGIAWLIGCIWFSLSLVIKSSIISVIAFLIYQLAVPNLGRFDLKNSLMVLSSEIGQNFVLQPSPHIQVSIFQSSLILFIWIALVSIICFFIFNKKTKYSL